MWVVMNPELGGSGETLSEFVWCPHLHSVCWFQRSWDSSELYSCNWVLRKRRRQGERGGGEGKREKICDKIMRHPRKYCLYELGPSSFVSSSLLINSRLVLLSSDT